MTQQLHEKAAAASSWFVAGERKSEDTGRMIRTLHDEARDVHDPSEWHPVKELTHHAHDDGDGQGAMMPDDWRYEMIEEVLDAIAEAGEDFNEDEDDELLDPLVSIYNAELLRWLGSHSWRVSYCDDAAAEMGAPGIGIVQRCGLGMLHEYRIIFRRVLEFLEECDEMPARVEAAAAEGVS